MKVAEAEGEVGRVAKRGAFPCHKRWESVEGTGRAEATAQEPGPRPAPGTGMRPPEGQAHSSQSQGPLSSVRAASWASV